MSVERFLSTKDYSVSGESFHLNLDKELDMLVTDPVPEDLGPYYDSEDYISHTDEKNTFIGGIYQSVKSYSFRKKLQLIDNQLVKGKKLLDFGAGTGDFLLAAQKGGYTVVGVEPSNKARGKAIQKGIMLKASAEELLPSSFDVITLWHVLEHLPNLDHQIIQLKSLLQDEGVLVVAVPNYKSYDALHYKKYWAAYDVPRHLWHFSRTAIAKLFERHDMEVVGTKPMIFDSFYVSLLSEKYKGKKWPWLKALSIGLLSNFKAMSSREHSSIIYLIKKIK
ncbi:class I SAM-dependent methyltransferase [Flagellimonas flava]|uniref:Methyltransferase domain-containing protein n=1 Tax=Flagellimonas flava TaxID=570519 RepID=A0A1M5KZS7_9FLAO|nr:class I SAM-dependent methyltransferase [Allomuricauda flava]SHG58372.1 Methyltransferase domain-containing protein [Allomuricauda flava]